MDNVKAPEQPGFHELPQKQNHTVEFPLEDTNILQSPTHCHCQLFNWKVLQTFPSALKFGQIVAAIIILALLQVHNGNGYSNFELFPEVPYIFFTMNSIAAALLILGDSVLKSHPLRRNFTPMLWFWVELWYTGLAAVIHHVLAYFVLFMTYKYYGINGNRVASAFGFISAGLYLVDWWRLFSKRHAIIQEIGLDVENKDHHATINQ